MKKTFYLYISLIGFVLALSFAGSVLAQNKPGFSCTGPGGTNCQYVPLEPLSNMDEGGNTTMATFINSLFKILFSLSALFAVAMLTMGGIEYMISDVAERKNEGIRRATAALYGILILAGSYLLLYTINPQLLNFDLTFKQIGSTGAGAQTGQSGVGNAPQSETEITGPQGGVIYDSDSLSVQAKALNQINTYCKGKVEKTRGTDSIGDYTEYSCVK
ncbi:MAG TPA: pilin [Candidatus Paceibacterota bacterium]|nr:pilin [Candidatus Paceibacterota bacterium]